jgi:hypothetical protein
MRWSAHRTGRREALQRRHSLLCVGTNFWTPYAREAFRAAVDRNQFWHPCARTRARGPIPRSEQTWRTQHQH